MPKRLTQTEFIDRANKVHNNKYDYSSLEFKTVNDNVLIICPDHGEFLQLGRRHLSGQGCKQCFRERHKITFEDFKKEAKKTHGNIYEYKRFTNAFKKDKASIICPEHGEFDQQIFRHLNGRGCPKCKTYKKLTTEEFIEKSKKIHGERFDYSNTSYNGIFEKVTLICKKHGEFSIRPADHLNQKQGCKDCGIKRKKELFSLGDDEFIKRSINLYGDLYDYSNVNYKNGNTKVEIKCKNHGSFFVRPKDHIHKNSGCPNCSSSFGEIKIRNFLNKIGADFVEQYRFKNCKNKKPLPFDFYLGSLLIECQGQQHYKPIEVFGGEQALKELQKRDQIKRDYCKKNEFQLLEIKYDDEKWKDKIEEALFKYLI